jgi:ABC-2 type transport system ATP-binding protein
MQYPGGLSPALDGLSLEVPEGAILGLLGPNGAGKTTTIHILCGLLRAQSGVAQIMGLDAYEQNKKTRELLGLVPQEIALYPTLTGWENFFYIGQLYGLDRKTIKKRAGELLERLGLHGHADKRVGRYSGGMKRRANIIASLLHHPRLLMLDEPTAGVDVQSQALIISFLKDYRAQGSTLIYTSHRLEEAEELCDTVVIVDGGKNVISGTPTELVANTPGCRRLEDVFLEITGHSVRD